MNPQGEALEIGFDGGLEVEFHCVGVTLDTGTRKGAILSSPVRVKKVSESLTGPKNRRLFRLAPLPVWIHQVFKDT